MLPACTCDGLNITDPGATSSVVTGLENGQLYTFQIQARSNAGPSAYAPQPGITVRPNPPVKVMTWNIERGMTEGDPALLGAKIASYGPDIVGLQEVTAELASAIADELGWAGRPRTTSRLTGLVSSHLLFHPTAMPMGTRS